MATRSTVDITAYDEGGIGHELDGLMVIGELITYTEEPLPADVARKLGNLIYGLARTARQRVDELGCVIPLGEENSGSVDEAA